MNTVEQDTLNPLPPDFFEDPAGYIEDHPLLFGTINETLQNIITALPSLDPLILGSLIWATGLKMKHNEGDTGHRVADFGAGIFLIKLAEGGGILGDIGDLTSNLSGATLIGRAITGIGYITDLPKPPSTIFAQVDLAGNSEEGTIIF